MAKRGWLQLRACRRRGWAGLEPGQAVTARPHQQTAPPAPPLPHNPAQAYKDDDSFSPGPVTEGQRRSLALAAREAAAAAADELDEVGAGRGGALGRRSRLLLLHAAAALRHLGRPTPARCC